MSESIELHTILVWLQGHQGALQYVYRTAARAMDAFKRANDKVVEQLEEFNGEHKVLIVEFIDDFGRKLFAPAGHVQAIQLIDLAAEFNGQSELALLQAHAQLKLQKRAQQDPTLGGRPMIVQPGQGGVMPFPPQGRG